MTSIVVSSDDHEACRAVGKKIASALSFGFIGGTKTIKEIAAQFDLPTYRILAALDPFVRRRLPKDTHRHLLSCIEAYTLGHLLEDNVVCAGLAAHLYVHNVSHILMIRVLTDLDKAKAELMEEEAMSERQAEKALQKNAERRTRWSTEAYGINEADPRHYDMVINLSNIASGKLVEIIKEMAVYRKFQPMTYSKECLENLALTAELKAVLLSRFSEIHVQTEQGAAVVHVKCPARHSKKAEQEIRELVLEIPGIRDVEVLPVKSLKNIESQ